MAVDKGTSVYDPADNKNIAMVEQIAEQIIENAESANPLDSAFPVIEVANGTTIEKTLLEMAQGYAFDDTAAQGWAQKDVTAHTRYFSDWDEKQYEATYRRDDVRAVLLPGGNPEEFAGKVVTTLTEGEGDYDFQKTREILVDSTAFANYSTIAGGVPANMEGVLYLARDMYNHLIATNSDVNAGGFRQKTNADRVRVCMSDKLLNLIDVGQLAHVFNLEKQELIGKIVVYNADDLPAADRYKLVVTDYRRVVRGRRTYEFSDDKSGRGLFINYFLTAKRMYAVCELYKGAMIDCTAAANAKLATLISAT